MMFPETGTREEIKAAVLTHLLLNACTDCFESFIPLQDGAQYMDVRCPRCSKRYTFAPYIPMVVQTIVSPAMMGLVSLA
jgi:DNA-directed RNA polymerase subunit RPC12/RpoP